MNELEQYIRTHAAEFDTEEPAPGHEARFLARLDSPVKPANDELAPSQVMREAPGARFVMVPMTKCGTQMSASACRVQVKSSS